MRLMSLFFAAFFASGIAPDVASAGEKNVEFTPFAAYRFGGTFDVENSTASYELDDSDAFGLLLNVRQSSNTQWEVLFSKQKTQARLRAGTGTNPSVSTDISVLQVGGTYLGPGQTFRPFLAMTLGGTHIKTVASGRQSDTFFSGSIGVGLNIAPNSRIGLRLEARAYGTLTNSDTDLFCRTGPDMNVCAIRIDGNLLTQVEAIAGVVFRF